MSVFPDIGSYAFLSDCETNALVAPSGQVEWLCVPRPESASIFGALLDRSAGLFGFGPGGVEVPSQRRYIPGTMVLETTWHTPTGWLVVTDALVGMILDSVYTHARHQGTQMGPAGWNGIVQLVDATDDGLGGDEGTFTICSFWLVSALALIGEHRRARSLCEKLLSLASPLHLYAEELDAVSGQHLGNYPQAFTHLALIDAVTQLIGLETNGSAPGPGNAD